MIHYFDASRLTAVDSICFHLNILLKKYVLPGQPVIVMCIGSDRSTGDSLGPLVGYKLSKFTFENVHVYGCLQSPIHAANLSAAIDKIRRQHSRPFIIALDASLGKKEHIGFITCLLYTSYFFESFCFSIKNPSVYAGLRHFYFFKTNV